MTTKTYHVGGEIVSYCTKCKMDLTHRIIAMVASAAVKVECRTCGSHHKYRKPMEDRGAQAGSSAQSSPSTSKKTSGTATSHGRATRGSDQEKLWESMIAGQPSNAFRRYGPTETFGLNDRIHHSKFGDGYVSRVIDEHKIEVLFQDGPRTLAQGLVGNR